ncbi:MAG: hypothetical protein H7Z42_20040, partial [Roseiflexaceae bacterium]|nr:hypothetical protein [Roseiflexaceae bacterium]
WAEWNGKYRDAVRRYWKGDEAQVAELAYRLSGSSDLYQRNGRSPYASINFITAHDGFTLRDLVSYNEKHNHANGEGNNDGESHNSSWNCGVEGETTDHAINALRAVQQRNMLATLLLSQGVPMLLAGDERNRTQRGNNNGYCQDNELSWLDWSEHAGDQELLMFTRQLIELRRKHPVLRRRAFFQGRSIHGEDVSDIEWYQPDGVQMSGQQWNNGMVRCLGMLLNGQIMDDVDESGQRVTDDILLLLLNAHHEPTAFTLPGAANGPLWEVLLDTAAPAGPDADPLRTYDFYELGGRSLVLLRQSGAEWAEKHGTTPLLMDATAAPAQVIAAAQTPTRPIIGALTTIASFSSPQLGNSRDILVYLPPGYADSTERYPVIYMHDGQNLFDERTAYSGEWRVDETMGLLAERGLSAIVVGIPNVGERRLDEYSPYADAQRGGGWGDQYIGFIADTLKPYIDQAFRTRPERGQTGVVGSSMGGLISLYAYVARPETFGFAALISPALWFATRAIFKTVQETELVPGRIYLDIGLEEGDFALRDARDMRDLLATKGMQPGENLCYLEELDAHHSEVAWAARLHDALVFLLQA